MTKSQQIYWKTEGMPGEVIHMLCAVSSQLFCTPDNRNNWHNPFIIYNYMVIYEVCGKKNFKLLSIKQSYTAKVLKTLQICLIIKNIIILN